MSLRFRTKPVTTLIGVVLAALALAAVATAPTATARTAHGKHGLTIKVPDRVREASTGCTEIKVRVKTPVVPDEYRWTVELWVKPPGSRWQSGTGSWWTAGSGSGDTESTAVSHSACTPLGDPLGRYRLRVKYLVGEDISSKELRDVAVTWTKLVNRR